jgi:hypothetical protein
MTFGNHLSLKKAKVFWVIFYRSIYAGDFGEEQSLSVRELSLLSLNKWCLLAITYRLKAKAISVIFYRSIYAGDLAKTVAKYSQAYIIAKQAMPFGDHSSLKSKSDFSTILALNMLAIWRWTIAKCSRTFITIAKYWLAIWRPIIA